jgi:AcrR family transcriptional regulator
MSPRETRYNKPAVLAAAVELVREKGWERLTARAVADRLGASVAPVYSTFDSMDALEREILEEARRRLHASTMAGYTPGAFLNTGVGIVVFAREEPHLFTALFHTRHSHADIVQGVFNSILERMKADPLLRQLSDRSLERLLHYLGMYTLGLAAAIVYGRQIDASTENIITLMSNAGNIMIFAEFSGLADVASPDHARQWARLCREKSIISPEKESS